LKIKDGRNRMVPSSTEIKRPDIFMENAEEETTRKKNQHQTHSKMDAKSGFKKRFRTHEDRNQ